MARRPEKEAGLQLIQIKVPRDTAHALRVYAVTNRTTMQSVSVSLYEQFLREQGMLPLPPQENETLNRAS